MIAVRLMQLAAPETHPASQGTLLAFGALCLLAAASVFVFPRLYDAGARFRYRLLRPAGKQEERAVRRDRRLRKLLAASFVVIGAVLIVRGAAA
jgi:hypothetical protein